MYQITVRWCQNKVVYCMARESTYDYKICSDCIRPMNFYQNEHSSIQKVFRHHIHTTATVNLFWDSWNKFHSTTPRRPATVTAQGVKLPGNLLLATTYIILGVQERPTATFKESVWVVSDRLHNLGPVETLDALSVINVTWAGKRRNV